jgi:hypothetical protein
VDLGDVLKEGGEVVGGGAALGAGATWALAALLVDLGFEDLDVARWVQRGGGLGAIAGFTALALRGLGVT